MQKLGGGTFGTVYEIERNFSGETEKAALKIISVPTDIDEAKKLISEGYDIDSINKSYRSEVDDIYKEYMLMAKLKGNSNIVYCDDILGPVPGEEGIGWVLCIKMELLTPLKKAFNTDNAEEQAIKVGIDLCNALVACQKHNIIHRDIKPENIMVSADGTYKLGDFGIAKTASGTASGTKTGTYSYMAPEVYNNKPYGIAADIYSVGMVLYWMLNGRSGPYLQPFPYKPTANEIEMANQRRFSGEVLPAPTNGSTQLKNIVLKALAFNPNQRFASPADFRQALMNLNTVESMEYNFSYETYEQTHSGWDQENRTQGNSWDETYAGTQGSVGTDYSKSTFGTMGAEKNDKVDFGDFNKKLDIRAELNITAKEAKNGCQKTVVITDYKKLSVTVPPGIKDGNVLRLKGAGKEDPATGKKGTVFVHIMLKNDSSNNIWSDNGTTRVLDISQVVRIGEQDFAKGTEVEVTVDQTKERIVVKIPPNTKKYGYKVEYAGKGLTNHTTGERGKLTLEFRVESFLYCKHFHKSEHLRSRASDNDLYRYIHKSPVPEMLKNFGWGFLMLFVSCGIASFVPFLAIIAYIGIVMFILSPFILPNHIKKNKKAAKEEWNKRHPDEKL